MTFLSLNKENVDLIFFIMIDDYNNISTLYCAQKEQKQEKKWIDKLCQHSYYIIIITVIEFMPTL